MYEKINVRTSSLLSEMKNEPNSDCLISGSMLLIISRLIRVRFRYKIKLEGVKISSAHDRNTKLNLANAYQIKNEAID